MKIGELFRRREASLYPSVEEIIAAQTAHARAAYPSAKNDIEALSLLCFTLGKNLQERTAERDRHRKAFC